MAILPVIIAPDPRLKAKCEPVACVDEGVAALMDDLLETMYIAPGIGLAAPQVNVHKRVLVIDISPRTVRGTRSAWPTLKSSRRARNCKNMTRAACRCPSTMPRGCARPA